jgi:hypothetical protein
MPLFRRRPLDLADGLSRPLAYYEYVIFGGGDPNMAVGPSLRRMLPLDVQVALRDAEKDLASRRNSPLRPLIEQLATSLDEDARQEIQEQVNKAQAELVSHAEVVATNPEPSTHGPFCQFAAAQRWVSFQETSGRLGDPAWGSDAPAVDLLGQGSALTGRFSPLNRTIRLSICCGSWLA